MRARLDPKQVFGLLDFPDPSHVTYGELMASLNDLERKGLLARSGPDEDPTWEVTDAGRAFLEAKRS